MKQLFKEFSWKFGLLSGILVFGVTLASRALLMKEARVAMESRMSEKASFLNSFYAFLISDALQRKDDVTLQQVMNRLEEDPEIVSVIVVDEKGEVRYHADPEKLGTVWNDETLQKALGTGDGIMAPSTNSGGRSLVLISPLRTRGKAHSLGAVRIEMTYRYVRDQLAKFDSSFRLALIGFITAGVGFMLVFARRWVTQPLEEVEKTVTGMHLVTAEPNLPEAPDEFGRVNKALNDMVIRLQAELQDQLGGGTVSPGDAERELVEKILHAFHPNTYLVIADKENKIISFSHDGLPARGEPRHLLDLITDVNFATLVGTAVQNEGQSVSGPIMFHDQPYFAVVLCIPTHQTKGIRTVIAMQAQSQKGESSI